jgi:hypothetical protein
MVGQKYGTPKKGYSYFCPHIFLPKQDRSRLPLHYRSMTTARTTFLSWAFLTSCDLRTAGITQPEQLTQRKSKRPFEGLVCIAWLFGFLRQLR